jgi:acylglycerol lipase
VAVLLSSASSPPAVAAQHTEGRLAGDIYWQAWLPETEPQAVVVIAHGVSEHSGRYRYVVETLVPEGIAVYAIDHRGHGRSRGTGAQIERVALVVSDLDQLVDYARSAHPGRKCFLLGHSMGGCIAIVYAFEHQDKLDGLVLSAPLAAVDAAPVPLRMLARLLSAVAPGVGVFQVDAEAVSRDPDEVRAYREDPHTHSGKLPARTVQEISDAVGRFPAECERITVPLLVMLGTADTLVPPEAGRMVHDRARSADKTLLTYEGFFHEIFNEPAGERDRPLRDLAGWLAARS